ncbi:MAG: hypothetical protein DMF63_11375 [Acidobacteria bacterium]|nr:MAG: hypothetical protein DMF63_11375 [Acidobacteriota bacterium]
MGDNFSRPFRVFRGHYSSAARFKIKNAFRVCDKRKAERQKINALALRIIVVDSQNGVHKSK